MMNTVALNARGGPFDLFGATSLDYKKYVLKRGKHPWFPWHDDITWSSDVDRLTLPTGKIVLPLDVPHSIMELLRKRLKTNPDKFMVEVGFTVEDDKEAIAAHKNWYDGEIGQAEKSRDKRKARQKHDKNVRENAGTWTQPATMLMPEIGTILRIETDWTFDLHNEHRNMTLVELIGKEYKDNYYWERDGKKAPGPWQVTICKGALLTVDRLYVRKGDDDFSSLTFVLRADGKPTVSCDGTCRDCSSGFKQFGVSRMIRFWAKLADVNKMVVSAMEETVKK
jgi:hypothetical protein